MSEWQPLETAPERCKVIVSWVNSHGKRRTTFAAYFPAGTLMMDDDVPEESVNEEGDNAEGGWFEESEAREPGYWPLIEQLTHWMPLPDPPKDAA